MLFIKAGFQSNTYLLCNTDVKPMKGHLVNISSFNDFCCGQGSFAFELRDSDKRTQLLDDIVILYEFINDEIEEIVDDFADMINITCDNLTQVLDIQCWVQY